MDPQGIAIRKLTNGGEQFLFGMIPLVTQ